MYSFLAGSTSLWVRNAAPCRSASNRGPVVTARLRDNAASRFLFAKRKNSVAGATNLEGARSLEVFAFEEKASAGHAIERGGGQYRRAVYARLDASVRVQDSSPSEVCVSGSGGCRAHRPLAYYGTAVISHGREQAASRYHSAVLRVL